MARRRWPRSWRPSSSGMVADRFFATERVMATLYATGAVHLVLVDAGDEFSRGLRVMLAFCLCYFPTIALTNAVTMRQVANPGRDFPLIRMIGTIGWIVITSIVGFLGSRATTQPFLFASGGLRRDVCVQPRGAAAHAAAGARTAGHGARHSRPRRAGDDEGPFVPGVRDRVVPRVYPAHVLLLVHEPVPRIRPASRMRRAR